MASKLFEKLKSFKGAEGDETLLAKQFEEIANAAFFSGRFVINRGIPEEYYYIRITDIEFYYHEDLGDIKDDAKYHKGDEPYFPVGSLHPNQSGIDVTFENEQKHFRASFLIRGYQTIESDGQISYDNKKTNPNGRPQDIWYDLFGSANMLLENRMSLEWEDYQYTETAIETTTRINVSRHNNRRWRYYVKEENK